jgi:hypothetical protein
LWMLSLAGTFSHDFLPYYSLAVSCSICVYRPVT